MSKNPVMWFKGMPIGPEVFQQNNAYLENTITNTISKINRYSWGINSITWDDTNLTEGILKLSNLSAITKENITIDITEEDDIQINLNEYKEEFKEKDLFIFLSIPNNKYTQQINITNPRYTSFNQEVSDFNDKEEKVILEFLKNNYKLEVRESASLQNISTNLGKLRYNGVNFEFTSYTPATQYISNSSIFEKLKAQVSIIKGKVKYLKSKKNNCYEDSLKLQSLSHIFFMIEKSIKCNVHPYELYTNLITATGSAFILSKNNSIPNINEYNHDNHLESMLSLLSYINNITEDIQENYSQLKFIKNDGIFGIPIENTSDTVIVGVEKSQQSSYQDIYEWINNSIIATKDQIESTQEERSKGARRYIIQNFKELDIQEIPGLILFEIKTNSSYINSNEVLCIFNIDEKLEKPNNLYLIKNN